MKKYRVRLIPFGSAGIEERAIVCSDDGEALITSHAMLSDFHIVEAWEGDRLICRVMRAGGAQPRTGALRP